MASRFDPRSAGVPDKVAAAQSMTPMKAPRDQARLDVRDVHLF